MHNSSRPKMCKKKEDQLAGDLIKSTISGDPYQKSPPLVAIPRPCETYRNQGHIGYLPRAALPPRGKAGMPRLRPVDTDSAKSPIEVTRNTKHGLRSEGARTRRKEHRKLFKSIARRVTRRMSQLQAPTPLQGQDTGSIRNMSTQEQHTKRKPKQNNDRKEVVKQVTRNIIMCQKGC